MLVQTRRFGTMETVEVPTSQLYEFYPGLGGFEAHHRYAVITDTDSPVEWLQSTADADVAFAMLDPFLFQPEYVFEMADADATALGLVRPDEAIVRTLLTLRDSAVEITANLMAPIVMNPRTRLGRQVVLDEAEWSMRYPVLDGLQSQQVEPSLVTPTDADATTASRAQAA